VSGEIVSALRQPIAGRLRIGGNRDLLPHLETHLEIFGDLGQIVPELVGGGRLVEGRVVAYGPEQWFALILILAMLSQAVPGERDLGLAPVIDLSCLAFVGFGRRTEADQGGDWESHSGGNCTAAPLAYSMTWTTMNNANGMVMSRKF